MTVACSGGGSGGDGGNGDDDDGDGNTPATRAFQLASTGVQMTPGEPLLFQKHEINGASSLAGDVDLIAVHNDFYGIPWEDFDTPDPASLPQPWVDVMTQLADYAHNHGRPVFLTLQLVHGPGRRHLADRTVVDNGVLSREQAWSGECYNFDTAADGAERRAQYLNYVEWMVRLFQPQWINVAAEVNAFRYNCRQAPGGEAAWEAMVGVLNDAIARVREVSPYRATPLYSVILTHAYGLEDGQPTGAFPGAGYDQALEALAPIDADFLGVSDYPYLHEDIDTPADIPEGWFTRIGRDLGLPVIIAETGWSALPVVAEWEDSPPPDDCVQAFDSNAERQRDYFDYLVDLARTGNIELITWWSNRDLVIEPLMTSCPVCDQLDATWCSLVQTRRSAGGGDSTPETAFLNEASLKMWGAMGIRRYDGTPRQPIFDRWQEVLSMPGAVPHD